MTARHDVRQILLFAPRNCTGNSGEVGDTVLQTSLTRTLLDRTHFPNLTRLSWYGTDWVVKELFDDLVKAGVAPYDWDGSEKSLGAISPQPADLAIICTREASVVSQVRSMVGGTMELLEPDRPLDAQSPIHLTQQLHSCIARLGISTSPPPPRIDVSEKELTTAARQLEFIKTLKAPGPVAGGNDATYVVAMTQGKHEASGGVDPVFFLHPSLKHNSRDSRTWDVKQWKDLARILGEVGVVLVAFRAGDADEQAAAQEIVSGEASYNSRLALGMSLRQRAAYACAATISVARDSGPMHVVSAATGPAGGARVLGLFSVMSPDTWKPLSPSFRWLGQWPLPLELCVTPKEVAVAAAEWLREIKRLD